MTLDEACRWVEHAGELFKNEWAGSNDEIDQINREVREIIRMLSGPTSPASANG